MLSSLQIENVAVIQKANVHFEKGLNVLTGETGAGKSILIDSINAILGNRTSKDLVRTGAAKAVIRAAFEDVPPAVLDSLEKAGYERSEALLLSREITAEGKSTCRINGMPATAAVLRELCGGLININGQHDSVGLLNPARHEGILDAYAQNSAEYQAYYAIYRELVGVKKTLDAMITDESEKQRRIDLLSYQVQEIDDAGLTAGEEQTLESRRKVLANASTIRDRIAQCYALLSGGDEAPGAVDLLGEASNAVDAAAQLDGELSAGAGQLLDLYYTAKDVAADLIGRLDAYDTNDAELDEIEQRIDLIYKLRRKYGDTVEDILAFGERARKELEMIQSSQERVEHLQKEQRRLYTLAREKAEALTQTRLKAFDELNKRISGTLDFLNMPGVRMTLRHSRGPLASHGQDSIEFYISTNPGEAPKPLAKIASGGELSRITLAIKNAMADKDAVPTVIYDEIDSGVSGKAASRIGEVLRQSAEGHQILCITHTAQIAALADCHLLIQKNITNERTYTEIHPLDGRPCRGAGPPHLRRPCHRAFAGQCPGNAGPERRKIRKKPALDIPAGMC
jgi:DNA repair protein RecN (Recombination protein N)